MIKLIDILSEIKVNQPINIKFIEESPRRGSVILGKIKMEYSYITGNEGIVGVEILCGYNDNILEKYADFSYEDHEEEDYYPVDESKEACIKILPYFSLYEPKIVEDGYGVSNIELKYNDILKRNIISDIPKYLGKGVFEWKGKRIRYERKPELDDPGYRKAYEVYNHDTNKLIDTVFTPNGDMENFMKFLESCGTADSQPFYVANIINKLNSVN